MLKRSIGSDQSVRGLLATRRYADTRPLMRGRYLVRSFKAGSFLRVVDALLGLIGLKQPLPPVPAKPARILVSNWAHLGDLLLTLPAIKALKDLFPEARIDLLTGRWSAAVVKDTGLFHQLHFVDHFVLNRSKTGWLVRLATYGRDRREFIQACRDTKYDVAIDFYFHFPPAAPLLWSAAIPVRCGYSSGGFGPLLTHTVDWSLDNGPSANFGLKLIKTLWPEQTSFLTTLKPCYPGYPQECSVAPPVPADVGYIVIHTGAGGSWKEWPEQNWSMLVASLLANQTRSLVFCGVGAREGDRARWLANALPSRCFLFLDQSWSDFVAVVAGAACVICIDSSAGHVAAAFRIPTVAIFTGVSEARLWAPDNPHARIVTAPTGCAPCHRNTGCEAMACVRNVQPADVLAALDDLGQGAASGRLAPPEVTH